MNYWCSKDYRIQYGLYLFFTSIFMHIEKEYLIFFKTHSYDKGRTMNSYLFEKSSTS